MQRILAEERERGFFEFFNTIGSYLPFAAGCTKVGFALMGAAITREQLYDR
jgi:hypothetical protein